MAEECVIIGGGVAGLSAANQLADAGISPLIIESGGYPSHKICGEYFSHESHEILHKWEIPLGGSISKARFVKGKSQIQFSLPIPAGGCSHFEFDTNLFNKAVSKGSRALCKTTVNTLRIPTKTSENYELTLSDGQTIQARHLIIGTGKIPKTESFSAKAPELKYFGFKAHFEGVEIDNVVEMHLLHDGYCGLAKVNATTANIAGIVRKESVKDHAPEIYINKILSSAATPLLKQRLKNAAMIFPKWLTCQIPEFGIRKNPHWERVFWIGDAAGGIPPVSGEGLAIAITSGCMAADYLLNSNAFCFQADWLKRYHRRYFWAQLLHKGLMRPWINNLGFKACVAFPPLPLYLWKLTREAT